MTPMRLGLLQCGHTAPELAADHGGYPEMYARLLGPGFDWSVYPVCDGVFPEGPRAAQGWLISGSRAGAYEAHDWIPPLEALIRDIVAARVPLVGICFGHQIIAQALGGRVEKFAGGWAVGRRRYEWDGAQVHLNAWHQDQVTRLPEGARVTASNGFTRYAGFRVGDRVETLQPHPEFSPDIIARMTELRGATVPPEMRAQAVADAALPVDGAAAGARLAAFFRATDDMERAGA
ncbi:type 1 glutamine amidotransferase [Palleronia sediminis]|nr:type 1 glutamine amidotransferase [Palleronia sediminis]